MKNLSKMFSVFCSLMFFGVFWLQDARGVTYGDYKAAVADNHKVNIPGVSQGDGKTLRVVSINLTVAVHSLLSLHCMARAEFFRTSFGGQERYQKKVSSYYLSIATAREVICVLTIRMTMIHDARKLCRSGRRLVLDKGSWMRWRVIDFFPKNRMSKMIKLALLGGRGAVLRHYLL